MLNTIPTTYEDTLKLVNQTMQNFHRHLSYDNDSLINQHITAHDVAAGLPGISPVDSEHAALRSLYNLVSAGQLHLANAWLACNSDDIPAGAHVRSSLEHSVRHYKLLASIIERRLNLQVKGPDVKEDLPANGIPPVR